MCTHTRQTRQTSFMVKTTHTVLCLLIMNMLQNALLNTINVSTDIAIIFSSPIIN